MVDETNVDDFLESILGRSLKGLAKSRIKKIAKSGLRKDPMRYPAGWKGEPGEKPGTFARKEDIPAVRGRQNRNPARSKGGARGRTAAAMQKDAETRFAVTRAARTGMERGEARKALRSAADAERKKQIEKTGEKVGKINLQKSGKETPESRAAAKAARNESSRVRGFRRVQGFLNRKLKVGDDAEARRLVDTAIANALDGKESESDPNKIKAAFANVRKIVMNQIAKMDGLDGAEKRSLQAEAKKMIAEAREALTKDLADRASLSKSGKGAQGRGRTVKKTASGRTRSTSDATGASAGQPRTNVGDAPPPVPAGKPKRKRFPGPRPVGKKGNTFGPNVPGSVEDKDGNLQAPKMPRRKKGKSKLPASRKGAMSPSVAERIKDFERRDNTRGRLFDDEKVRQKGLSKSDREAIDRKKKADAAAKRKKNMKESLVIDVVSRFANTEDV
jgi:hypothetical protein